MISTISYCFSLSPSPLKRFLGRLSKLETIGWKIHYKINDCLRLKVHQYVKRKWINHRYFNKCDILLFPAWSIFLKTVLMEFGRWGNNRISYIYWNIYDCVFTKIAVGKMRRSLLMIVDQLVDSIKLGCYFRIYWISSRTR